MRKASEKKYQAIVMGASSGGTEAISTILSPLPANFKLPVIIVLHRKRNGNSHLIDIIQQRCKIKIKEADEKEPIKEGIAYVAPADYHLLVDDDKTFSLTFSELVNYSRPSIDVLFESAAIVYKEQLIGIILTGANYDGKNGIIAIHKFGGLTIAQNPDTAEAKTMPLAAIASTKIDHVFSLKGITEFLLNITHSNEQG